MNKKLLARIEALETLIQRLEQEIIDIRNSCICLAPFEPSGEDMPTCEPFEDELKEEFPEGDDTIYCSEPEDPEEEVDHD